MNTKRIKTAIGSIALFAVVGASILTSMPNEGKNVKAEGDKYTLSLQGDSVGLNFATGDGTWSESSEDYSTDRTTLTLEASHHFYFGGATFTNFSAGDTIIISFDVKTSQTTAFYLFANNDPWTNISNTENTAINAPEYTHFDYAYTCKTNPSDGFHYFGFTVTWAGTVYFQNIYIYKTTSIEVNAGEAIGETLPEVGEKNGSKGYWAIDGERIDSTTIYNYGMNKFAMKKYARNVYLRGESTGVNFTANTRVGSLTWGGWNRDSSDNSWIIPADQVAVYFGNDAETTNFSEGDEILISFDLKATGSVYLNLQVQLPEWCVLNGSWYTNQEYAHFDIYFKIPTTYETYSFYFQNTQSGTANIKNLVISKPTVLTIDEGETLGSLPTGVGNWYYNGTIVDENSVLDFSTLGDKKAILYSDIDNVRNFVTDYMHLGDDNYQGVNVNGGHCISDGTYAKAKEAYNKMNSTNKQLFNSVKEFNEAKERLSKWATANKDVLEDNNLVALSKITASYSFENNFVVISLVSLIILITSTLIFFKRKRA